MICLVSLSLSLVVDIVWYSHLRCEVQRQLAHGGLLPRCHRTGLEQVEDQSGLDATLKSGV